MKIKAILNRDGGTFRTTDMKAYEAEMAEIFSDRGHALETVVVEGSDIGAALEKAAGRDDLDAIIAGGGDGTISSAAGIAWKAGMPLGVIPAGTMNLFARTLRLPLDIWQVLPVLADGVVDDADIGSVNGRAFVHQFSAGMHARMVRYRNQMSYGSRAGKIAANVRAAVGAVLNPPRFEIEFEADGHRDRRMVSAISVSNNPFGENGLLVAEDIKTGHLGFYIADPLDPAGAVGLAVDVLRGRLKANPAITEMKAQSVDLHFPKLYRAANFVLDGELMRLPRDVEIRLHPGELKVIAPRESSLKPIDQTV